MPELQFRKSSYSSLQAECVEVARNVEGVVAVRDSKALQGDPAPMLRLTPDSWTRFVGSLGE